jgi:hypothetical protein
MKFYGSDLSVDELEILSLTTIHHSNLGNESLAMQNKWFEYRLWPNMKATYYFADCYIKAYKNHFATTKDREIAKLVPAFNHEDPMRTKQRTNLHLARQAFDMIGVRYDFGIAFVMKRFCERGWKSMPRPNQLYGEETVLDIKDYWDIECRSKLQIPKSEFFGNDNYVGHVIQKQYHDWIEGQIKSRGNAYMSLGQIVYVDKVMPEKVAIDKFGKELVSRGKRDAIV